jgi:hypothetical protein
MHIRSSRPPRAARKRDEEMLLGIERAILIDMMRAYLNAIARTLRTGHATPIGALMGHERCMADRLSRLPPLTQRVEPGIWKGSRPASPPTTPRTTASARPGPDE